MYVCVLSFIYANIYIYIKYIQLSAINLDVGDIRSSPYLDS